MVKVKKQLGLFELGSLVITPGAAKAIRNAHQSPLVFYIKHGSGDWGTVDKDDWKLNDDALKDGYRVFSAYLTKLGEKIWVITEANRSSTCILLPSEY